MKRTLILSLGSASAVKIAESQQPGGFINQVPSMPVPTAGVLPQYAHTVAGYQGNPGQSPQPSQQGNVNLAQTDRVHSTQSQSPGGMSGSTTSICDSNLKMPVCSRADNWGKAVHITHSNACFASQLGFGPVETEGNANPHYENGPCTIDQHAPSNEDAPICVHDLFVGMDPLHPKSVTFPNMFWVQNYYGNSMMQKLEEKGGANWKTNGPCSANCKDPCEVFQPVCGRSPMGITTFPNLCAAQVMSLQHSDARAGVCADQTNPNVVFPHFWNTEGWLQAHSAPTGYRWETRPFLVPENRVIVPSATTTGKGNSRKIQFRVQECIEIKLICIRTRDGDFRTYMNRCLAQEDGYYVGTDDPANNLINDIAHLKSSNTEEVGECRENAHQRYIGKSDHGSPEAGCEKLAPVCSADGLITFLNTCQAHKMGYTDVSKLLQGACFNNDQVVSADKFFEPVCDVEKQVTFVNTEMLSVARSTFMSGSTYSDKRYQMGACSRWGPSFRSKMPKAPYCKFEQILDPICARSGVKEVTFLNRCAMLQYKAATGGSQPGVCRRQSSSYALLQESMNAANLLKNPIEQGLWAYPYWMKLSDIWNPAEGKHAVEHPRLKINVVPDHEWTGEDPMQAETITTTRMMDIATMNQKTNVFMKSSKDPVLLQTSPGPVSTAGGATSSLRSTGTTPSATITSLNMAESALWALRNCTELEPICDVQESLTTHLNWCQAQRSGVSSPVGTVYKACPAGGLNMHDVECADQENAELCVAGAKFTSRCSAWEAGETNIRAAIENGPLCESNTLEISGGSCPTPQQNDDVCSLANGFTHYQSMCKLQEDGPFWLPFILEGKCSELARIEIDIQGMWPRCSTVQEAFDRFNQTFEAAITDALLLMREQRQDWRNLNSFGWAFGASCPSCAGSASGCMMQKLEQLGLLGEDEVPMLGPDGDDLDNNLRSNNFWNRGGGDSSTTSGAASSGATSTSFVQTEMKAGRFRKASTALKAQKTETQYLPDNWRRANNYHQMKVRVGMRCHNGEDDDGNACRSFTQEVFSNDDKMKTISLHIRHNLEQSLGTGNAKVVGMQAFTVGGAGTLTWSVDANSTVINLYANVEANLKRVKIVDVDGNVQALVAFHHDMEESASSTSGR